MTEKPENVRLAEPPDEPNLFSLLVEMHRYNNAGWGVPYRMDIVRDHIEQGTRRLDMRLRTNPNNQGAAVIGVIGPLGGRLEASIGLFVEPIAWFSDVPGFMEKWLYVRPDARDRRRLERDLFNFARWNREFMGRGNQPFPFRMLTGFTFDAPDPRRFRLMDELWRRLSGGRKIGSMFLVE